jgi:hypothetical protein
MHVENKENAMNRLIKINGRQIYGFRFQSPELAKSFAEQATKPQRIILGDHPEFWVVRPVDAERLVRAGYEYAN